MTLKELVERQETMSDRRKSKASARTRTQHVPSLWFTLDEVVLLKKALVPFEQLLVTNKQPLPNLEFAHETLRSVQKKLSQMLQCSEEAVPLDKNEIIVLHSSLWIYMLALQETRGYEKMLCLALSRKIMPAADTALQR
jgi:hypothetical protein